jgi:hypothetical protein
MFILCLSVVLLGLVYFTVLGLMRR